MAGSRDRPRQVDSHRPPKLFKSFSSGDKAKGWDPRFESDCGTLQRHHFQSSYKFLFDKHLEEQHNLQEQLKEHRTRLRNIKQSARESDALSNMESQEQVINQIRDLKSQIAKYRTDLNLEKGIRNRNKRRKGKSPTTDETGNNDATTVPRKS